MRDCRIESTKSAIYRILSDGLPHNVLEIREMRKKQGFTKKEIAEAKAELGITVTNDAAMQEDGKALNWFWQI